MPAPSWETLSDFFDTDGKGGFAVVVMITFQAGGTKSINALFDDPTENAHTGEFEATFLGPHITCSEIDIAGVARYDTVTVAGTIYDVVDNPQLDSTGVATVKLAPQAF